MVDLTAANAVITFTIPGVFNTPQQLQGFAADDIFSSDPIEVGEGSMGVDGIYSAGFVFKEIAQKYNLQADSDSNFIFDSINAYEKANLVKVPIEGLTSLPGLGTKWGMSRGFLMMYTPIPAAGRIVKPRSYEIRWNTVAPQPT